MGIVRLGILISLFILVSCNPKQLQVVIGSPVNNYILPSESTTLAEVKGFLQLDLTEKKRPRIDGDVYCNGVKAEFTDFAVWNAKNVLITEFKEGNLKCEYRNPKYTTSKAITVLKNGSEVQDPGEAGRATLEGIDVNNDGVRDDVEVWINKTYTDPDVKNAMREMAKLSQKTLIESQDKEKSIANARSEFRAQDCLIYIAGIHFQLDANDQMRLRMLDTKERLLAEFKVDEHFNGQSGIIKDAVAEDCNFKVQGKGFKK